MLTAALDDTIAGRGQMVMLAGEPGIGKTRLARELSAYAEEKGVQVLLGSCYEGEGAPSYWAWTQAITICVDALDPGRLAEIIGSGDFGIGEIIPQIADKLPAVATPPDVEPEQARFQLFNSVATFLGNVSASGPILIVLEDLQWADNASLLLLEFVINSVSDTPLMVVATYRDVDLGRRHPLSRTLGELVREPNFRRIRLNSFNPDEVSQFVMSRSSISLDSSDLELVHTRTGGNPLFLNELMCLQADEGDTDAESWKTGLPEGVRDVIGLRLDRLSESCNEALTIASVIGPEFGFDQLRPLLEDATGDRLLELLEEALSGRVIEEMPGSPGRYRFAHALIQETLNEELSMTGRVRLHVRVAEMMEAVYGSNSESHAAELAYHYSLGAMLAGPEKMVHYSKLAANQALMVHAPEEALVHFQRALDVKEERPMDDETAALLFGLGTAQVATLEMHQMADAVVTLERAFDYFVEGGEMENALSIAESTVPRLLGLRTGMARLLERALELAPEDSLQNGRLLSRYGQELGGASGDYEAAQPAFNKALEIARRERDEVLEMRILAASSRVDFTHTRYVEAAEKSAQVIALAPRFNDLIAETEAHRNASMCLRNIGDPEAAKTHASAALSLAKELRNRGLLALALALNATLCQLRGDWSASREYTDAGMEVSYQNATVLVSRTLLEYELGNLAEGGELLARMIKTMHQSEPGPSVQYAYTAIVIPLVARITGIQSNFDVAAAAARTVLSSELRSQVLANNAISSLGIIGIERNDVDAIKEQYSALLLQAGTILTGFLANVDRILGPLSSAMGNLDQSTVHFEDAMAFCRKAGYLPELAWTCCDYADALLQREKERDRAMASSLLDESLTISTELGMRPLMERVTALQERADAQPVKASAYPDGLTQREVEVLQLICGGKTDREIAEELFISFRTVGNHVRSILNKTATANRTEAATYAALNGLTSDSGGVH